MIELVAIEQWFARFEDASRRPTESDTAIAAILEIDRNRISEFAVLLVPPAIGQVLVAVYLLTAAVCLGRLQPAQVGWSIAILCRRRAYSRQERLPIVRISTFGNRKESAVCLKPQGLVAYQHQLIRKINHVAMNDFVVSEEWLSAKSQQQEKSNRTRSDRFIL